MKRKQTKEMEPMVKYKPRTTSPDKSNKYYIHKDGGGYNRCIKISANDCLPNCVGYAHGRYLEAAALKSASLPVCNAEDWYDTAKKLGIKVSKKPMPGYIAVWRKGKTKNSADGCGHVAVVEYVFDDGSIQLSNSGYNYKRFYNTTMQAPYGLTGYVFLGFIVNEHVEGSITKIKISYEVGEKYTVVCSEGVNLRAGADISDKKKAVLPKGTKVKCLKISKGWMKVKYNGKSGWICCKQGKDIYVK